MDLAESVCETHVNDTEINSIVATLLVYTSRLDLMI